MTDRDTLETSDWIAENRSTLEHIAAMDNKAAPIAQHILDAEDAGRFK